MKAIIAPMTLSFVLLAGACDQPESATTPESQPGVAAPEPPEGLITRAVDYQGAPPPLPPGSTLFINPNRQLAGPAPADGRVAAASASYIAGSVHTAVWSCINWPPVAYPTVQCAVDPDYVLVGGGAWASGTKSAVLTASYPVDPDVLKTWEGRSKEHAVADPHVLTVYAIGLKIDGVSRSTLLGKMFVSRRTSTVAAHPSTTAPYFDPSILDTSVGCFDDWHGAGNLLTQCMREKASGKDHIWSDPATIAHYRLGIAAQIPGFGTLETDLAVEAYSDINTGLIEVPRTIPSGWVPTGIAGNAGDDGLFGPGRMLTRMAPFATSVSSAVVGGRDIINAARGTITLHLFVLRKAP
jgi:hypothetical protein